MTQCHFRLLWRPIAFAIVAADAGRDEILPDILATTGPGKDVVERQARMGSAILARVAIALEDGLTARSNGLEGAMNHRAHQ